MIPKWSQKQNIPAMTVAAFLLVVAGVAIIALRLQPPSFDFAVAVRRGWHVIVFPPPTSVGVLAILLGIVMFVAVVLRR